MLSMKEEEDGLRRGESNLNRRTRGAGFVCMAAALAFLYAASDLFVVNATARTPQAVQDPRRARRRDATRPPGGEQNQPAPPEARPAPQDPSAPPGASSLPAPQAPPGAGAAPEANEPAPVEMPATGRLLNELSQDPSMRSDEVRPTPPVPDYRRVGVKGDDVLTLSLNDAIRLALENNSDIEVARGDVRVAEGTLLSLEGVYDPVFSFSPQVTNSVTPTTSSIGGAGSSGTVTQNSQQFDSAVTKQFGTGGGQYQFFFNNLRQSTSSTLSRLNPFYSASLGVTFTQPLWRNRSIDTYRHAIRVQRKKVGQTDAEFRLRTTEIINQVQHAYWELVFALHAQKVALDSLNLAREQFNVTEQGVAAGTTAPLGRAEVDTQIATNEANLLAAAKNVTLAENAFKQLVLRDPTAPEWRASVTPTDEPAFDLTPASLDDALAEARANRPELNNLRIQEEINRLDVQYARNQTRPRIDLVSTVSMTGLAGSPVSSTIGGGANAASGGVQVSPDLVGGYGKTLGDLFRFNTRNVVAGVTVEFPLRNRTAEGNLAVARAQGEQLTASLHSQEQAVESDVRNSVQTLETARQTVLTTRRARESAELQLAGELELFRAGQSTTFLVFQRENALASARNAELRAEADYDNALADLQRATGTTIRANEVVVSATAGP